jgi:hypothetical protein
LRHVGQEKNPDSRRRGARSSRAWRRFAGGASDGSIVQEAQEIGAVDYFIKGDMQMVEIVERIQKHLSA